MTTSWKKALRLVTMTGMGFSLAACEGGLKQTLGTWGGAMIGGVAGSHIGDGRGRLIATGLGTLVGAVGGGAIGQSLDRADQLYLQQTTRRVLESVPSGRVAEWSNPDSGNRGTVRAEPAFRNSSGAYCREFMQTVTIGSETHVALGTSCRQPDGSWEDGGVALILTYSKSK